MSHSLSLTALVLAPVLASASTPGEPLAPDEVDLTEYSLEQLMDLEVTIASRSAEPLSKIPGAVYVLTGDEIRRAGHTSIAEALRMVPGFHVSHWTNHGWDVTSRGFGNGLSLVNQAYLNQLLVMIDGVVVYSPQFAGVWWPIQEVMLENVDRVEIVRGPGGVLWGSNAVHGVVNIITKHGSDTEGALFSGRSGTDERVLGARYGYRLGEDAWVRGWVQGHSYDMLADPFVPEDQSWKVASFGARLDWKAVGKDFSLWARGWDGDFKNRGFDLDTFQPIQVEDDRKGAQVLARMSDPDAKSSWQAWFSSDQQDLPTLADIRVDTFDVEYQRTHELGDGHRLNWGAGFRYTDSYFFGDDPFFLAFDPPEHDLKTYRVFALDSVPLGDSDVTLTFGSAFEHNSITGFEAQPTVRATWTPERDYMLWAAVSRTVRTPSLEETSDSFWGNPDFRSETLIAYELGGRTRPTEWMTADLALYFNDYDDLHLLHPVDFVYVNESTGHAYGAELALDLHPLARWKLRSTYTYHHGEYVDETTGERLATDEYSPKHAFSARSYYDLAEDWEFDTALYGVQGMGADFEIAEYLRLDARLAWRPAEDLEVYGGVQGATEPQRSEFDEFDGIRRRFYVGIRLRS